MTGLLLVDRMVVPLAGGDPVELVSPGQAPTWSPDDQLIGYQSGGVDSSAKTIPQGLSVVGTDGTGERLIDGVATTNPWAHAFPQWSPDGQRIAYHAQLPNGNADIFVAATDGSGIQAVGPEPKNGVWPVWAPDGNRIAYVGPSTTDGMYQIGVIDPDGTNARTLEHPPLGCNCAFKWSPDGTKVIAYEDGPVVNDSVTSGSLMVTDVSGTVPVETIGLTSVISADMSWQRLAP